MSDKCPDDRYSDKFLSRPQCSCFLLRRYDTEDDDYWGEDDESSELEGDSYEDDEASEEPSVRSKESKVLAPRPSKQGRRLSRLPLAPRLTWTGEQSGRRGGTAVCHRVSKCVRRLI